jgi:predicted pyridoxine 5'-phosphate oxidase superfamily flavin-nucleotide-binding protein
MSFQLSPEAIAAFRSPDSVKIIATVGKDGAPHAVPKGLITILDDGSVVVYELLETSQTQKNLVYSIWFHKTVAVTAVTPDHKSYQIKGVPQKAIIAGQLFLDAYDKVQKLLGEDVDLSALWLITPETEREQTFSTRQAYERAAHPYEIHIDHITKEEYK